MSNADPGSSLAFYIDEDLPPRIAELLRADGIHATSVLAEGKISLPDEDQLQFAAEQGLVLVTANITDFASLARQWTENGKTHPGMVFVTLARFPRRDASSIARALRALAAQETRQQLQDSARFLTGG